MKKFKRIVRILPLDQRRFKVIYIFSLLIIFGLFGRLVKLQVFSSSDLQKKARLIQSSRTTSFKKRRSIVDRNNRLIAYDKTLYKLWAHPKYFNFPGDSNKRVRSIEEVVKKLSPIVDIKEEILMEIISDYFNKTKSVKAAEIINNFSYFKEKFKMIVPPSEEKRLLVEK